MQSSIGSDCPSWLIILFTLSFHIPQVWNGFACTSNPCIHGVCLDDLNSTYFCYCIDGYTGVQCQTNWNECWSSPCQNGGICIDGIASFNCSCPPGFIGDICQEDYNECISNPCRNNGTCLDATNGYTCNCLQGYSGVHCEIDEAVCNTTNETKCENAGICVEGPGDTFTCKCPSGWGGFLCDMEINECISAPCQNGAICIDLLADYSCACLFGYTGKNCEEVVQMCEVNTCSNGALCLIEGNSPVCYCVPDYHGDLCQYQYDECLLGPKCLNGGTCIDGIDDFSCFCPPNLSGVLCECLILSENQLDCSYVSPKTLSPIPPSTIETSSSITTPISITDQIDFDTSTISSLVPKSSTELEITETIQFFNTTILESSTIFDTTPKSSSGSTEMSTTSTEFFDTTTYFSTSTNTAKIDTTLTSTEEPTVFYTETETSTTEGSTTEIDEITSSLITEYQTQSTLTEILYSTSMNDFFTTTITSDTTKIVTEVELFGQTSTTVSPTFLTTLQSSPEGRESNISLITDRAEITSTTFYFTGKSTTEEYEISSTSAKPFDCSKNRCQNGGTCVYANQNYQCVCPFDTEGQMCEIHLGVKIAAFRGDSYLTHKLQNLSNIDLEFVAKTLLPKGVLFFLHIDVIQTFMTLYNEGGYLKFKFSCGYQTMLLSELKVPINNGHNIKVRAELIFDKNLTHCYASIKVNDSLSMSGDQIAQINRLGFESAVAWLHFGGANSDLGIDLPSSGFIGCIWNLKISNKNVNIFRDAQNGFEIVECSSLVCLSNPCNNGATCVPHNDSWECNCKNGYLGRMCEISVCDNNPCLFGGTCVPFSASGYICLCPFGKHGHFCENDLKISKPFFSSTIRGLSSYIAYPVPPAISRSMELKFRFIPTVMEQISLLMFVGQKGYHNSYSDHIAVSFVKGYIMLTWNLGSGPRRIFTKEAIKSKETSQDYLVQLGFYGRRAWLFVEDLGNVTGRSPGNLVQLDVVPILYFGGHDSRNFSILPHDLPFHTGFSGCIYDIRLAYGNVEIPLNGNRQTIGRAIGECGTTECHEKSCQNNGACLHHASTFMCLCQDSSFGPLCSSKQNPCDSSNHNCSFGSTCVPLIVGYECDCPIGKIGKYCEKDEDISDVSFSGRRSFLSLNYSQFENKKVDIEMEIRPLSDRGLLLYIEKNYLNYISLSLQSDILELKVSNGKSLKDGPISLTSSKILVKGIWYKISLGVFGRKIYLSVDNTTSTALLASNGVDLNGNLIFLGGLSDLSILPSLASSSLPVSFKGCIRNFLADSKHLALTKLNIIKGRNLNDCDGTPCGKDSCENGGSCWLDSSIKAHCSCLPPFYGENCEIVPSCTEIPCKNSGICLDNKCSCNLGYRGTFCEKPISVVKMPEFTGKSYLIVDKNNKKRDVNVVELRSVYLNFTTVKENGLFLWSSKDNNFIGIGVESGYLKIAYAIEQSSNTFIDVSSYQQISDGLWHYIEINFQPFQVKLDEIIFSHQNKFINLSTNGVFYIGGVPTGFNLWNETKGIYSVPFEGCIEGFSTNSGEIIKDFTTFEGTNVDICNSF